MSAALERFPRQVTDHPKPIERMELTDVESQGQWLAMKLQKRSSLATTQAVKTWLRSCLMSNDVWFVKSGGAVAMATLVREPLKMPRAEERFVFAKDETALEDAADLYIGMAMWANMLDCIRLEVGLFTDVPKPAIVARLGPLRPRDGFMVLF